MKSKYCTVLFLIWALFRAGQLHAQADLRSYVNDPAAYIPEKLVDIEHIDASLSINPYKRLVDAEVVFDFYELRNDVDSVVFFSPGIQVTNLFVDEQPTKWYSEGTSLIVFFGSKTNGEAPHRLKMSYQVSDAAELHFVGWDDESGIRRKQIWAHRPFGWLPYVSDRLTMDLKITFDQRFKVFSNGTRMSAETNQDAETTTWHYRLSKPHPFFSTALVIGDYEWKTIHSNSGLPVELWYYPDQKQHLEPTYQFMSEMVDFCEAEFGLPYPYESYRQVPVTDYLYGGMETTTSTVFGDFMFIDGRAFWERNYLNVNVHELSHNWFGNDISHLRGKDVWLTESFATYYAKRFERMIFGEDHYQWERQKELERVLAAARKDDFPVGSSLGGVDRWYPKGSLVLDMLRHEMGDANFKKAITHYLKKHQQSEVWTPDLQKAIYESTGMSLDWFFDQWIERGGEPHYRIRYEDNGPGILLKVEQIQEINPLKPVFRARLTFEVGYVDGSRKHYSFYNDQKEQLYIIPKDMPHLYVLFDPGNMLLKQETFERSDNEVFDQLLNTPNMIDRYRALVAMRQIPADRKNEVLQMAWQQNSFHLIRAEILSQLRDDANPASIELFKVALNQEDVLVRRAAITHFNQIHMPLVESLEHCLTDTSYSNIVLSLRKLTTLRPQKLNHYLHLTRAETGFPGLNVRIAWLETAIAHQKLSHLKELKRYLGPSYDFKTRINAIEAIGRLNLLDAEIASQLVQAALHWNFRLSPVAQDALQHFLDLPAQKSIVVAAIDKAGSSAAELRKKLSL